MNPTGPADIDLSSFGIVALVLAAVALGVWWWRNKGGVAATSPIQLLALRSLGGKRILALVEVEEEKFLLGMTDAQISCLGRLDGSRAGQLAAKEGRAA